MTRRLIQEMRCKITVWQEAYGSVRQTSASLTRNSELIQLLHDEQNCYFRQDRAPAHYARKVRDYLNQLFPNRWIGRRSLLKWAARSPDLTPHFFLWGFLKSKVYFTPPQNLKELEQKLEHHVD